MLSAMTEITEQDRTYAKEKAALTARRERIEQRQSQISWLARTFNPKAKKEYKTNIKRLRQIRQDIRYYDKMSR